MQFIAQPIPITHTSGETRSASGIVGEGTGLGYYQTAEDDWCLVHLQSGTKLGSSMVQTQGQVQKWLELVSQITNWNRPIQELRADPSNAALRVEIEQARARAIGQI